MRSTFRKALPLLALLAAIGLPLAAQGTDCASTFSFTTNANQTGVSNLSGQTPCVNWRVTYSVTGTLTSTVTFQTSPDNTVWTSVPNTLCSSIVQPPCMLQGTNPLTGTTQGMAYFAAYGAWVRVITTGSAGAGTGTVRMYGAKGATASAASGGSGNGSVTSVSFTGGLISVATPTTTPALTVAGTSGGMPYFSSISTWASSGLLTLQRMILGGGAGGAPTSSTVSDNGTNIMDNAARNWGIGTWARTGNTAPGKELVTWGGDTVVGDPSVLGAESLTNGALTAGTGWAVTGDFALSANEAIYTHFAGSGTLTQTSANLAVAGVGNRWYKFTYTLTVVLAGVTGCSITNAFADTAFGTAFDITTGVAKIFYFKSATTPGDFVISCTSAGGEIILDDLSLKEIQGGNAVVYGLITGGGATGLKVNSSGNVGIGTTVIPTAAFNATRAYFTMKGSSGSAVIELNSGAADGLIQLGQFTWSDVNNSQANKVAGQILMSLTGGTANNRGSDMVFTARPDNAAAVVERLRLDLLGAVTVPATGVLQQLPRTTDPTCAAVGDIGKFWFDNTTNTTARKACNNVAGTLTWVAF